MQMLSLSVSLPVTQSVLCSKVVLRLSKVALRVSKMDLRVSKEVPRVSKVVLRGQSLAIVDNCWPSLAIADIFNIHDTRVILRSPWGHPGLS